MFRTTLFAYILLMQLPALSQVPDIMWQHCYGSELPDDAYCISGTDNGYLIGLNVEADGPGISNYHGGADIWLLNIDNAGSIIWERCYGGSGGERPSKIVRTFNNHYYLFGISDSQDGDVTCGTLYGFQDFWVVKMDAFGNIIWDRCYGSPYTDSPRNAVATPDGGLLFMGRVFTQGGDVSVYYGSTDIWLCKLDSLGNIEWEKTMGNEETDNAIHLEMISDSTFAFIGSFDDAGGMIDCEHDSVVNYNDVWLVEMNLQGEMIRQLCYGGSHKDLGLTFQKLDDGYILASVTDSDDGDVSGLHGSPGYSDDIWVARINEQGDIIWQKCLGGSTSETPYFITQVNDLGFVVIGTAKSEDGDVTGHHGSEYTSDIWVVKLNQNGNIEWNHCYGGSDWDKFWVRNTIYKKSDYNYVFAAQSDSYDGDLECDIGPYDYRDAWIFEIKDTTVGLPTTVPATQALTAYPNPAHSKVIFSLGKKINPAEKPQITITNALGREITAPVLYFMEDKIVWDVRKVQRGIYFYQVEADGEIYVGKVLIQ